MEINAEELNVDVGNRLRQLRLERGMSMRAIAKKSGLSTNALSMIERGKTSPSVSTLYKIAEAMAIPITAFFRIDHPRQEVVYRRSTGNKRYIFPGGVWEGLGGEEFIGSVEPFKLSLESRSGSGDFGMLHSGHEFVYCLRGQIIYEVEGKEYLLHPGDSLLFAAQLDHRWRNVGNDTADAIIVLSGFEYGESPSEYHYSTRAGGVSA